VERWRNFWRLNSYERGLVIEASTGLVITWVGLRLAGFRRWKATLEWLAPRLNFDASHTGSALHESARVIARAEAAAARNIFFSTNCLEQSLVLWWLLRLRGIAADLRIGARKDADRFEAHAWVEFDGNVLNGGTKEHLHFVPFEGQIISVETPTQ